MAVRGRARQHFGQALLRDRSVKQLRIRAEDSFANLADVASVPIPHHRTHLAVEFYL
jgi:hypothetical protein